MVSWVSVGLIELSAGYFSRGAFAFWGLREVLSEF